MTTERNIAVIGAGYWGKNLVRNFHELGVLRTVCDSSADARAAMQKSFPGLTAVASPDAVLADPDVKAVAIASPAETHYDLVRQALLAGKDAYVEKPLALTVRHGENLVDIARRENRIRFRRMLPPTFLSWACFPISILVRRV